ncbi:MAG TPA: hypothetical protein VNT22_05020 [Baekduia sp.]|nr:hypothetical protein [Baekduia sp.]
MEKLRSDTSNGAALAVGSVALTVAVVLTFARLGGPWAAGVNFVYISLAAALVLGIGFYANTSGRPAPWLSAVYVSGFVLAVFSVVNFADLLGTSTSNSRTVVWVTLLLLVVAGAIAWFRNSGVMTLACGLLGIILAVALIDWLFTPDELTETARWVLIFVFIGYFVIALLELVPQTYRQVAVVDAAGFALLIIGLTFASRGVFGAVALPGADSAVPTVSAGWELVILVGSLLLVAYALLEGAPGPGYLAGFNLALFVVLAALNEEQQLLWWPVIIGLVAILAFAAAFTGTRIPTLADLKARRT